MSEETIAEAFAAHGNWVSRFVIDGVAYGGPSFDPLNDPRIEVFFDAFPSVETILELGSLEGGHTVALSQHAGVRRVLGVEGRASNLKRAHLVSRLLNARGVEFVEADLERADLREFGCFDAIFCSGLVYHLEAPWNLLRQFTGVGPRLFLWTHYCKESESDTTREGYKGRLQVEGGVEDPLSGLSQFSFWPTLDSLEQMLRDGGFRELRILRDEFDQPDGPAITIAASA